MLSAAFGTGMRCIVATATHVTDGNSFDATADFADGWGNDCHVQQGDQYQVRLIGIEAPTGDQCYAQEATDYLKNLIEGKRVCLMRDIGCRDSSGQLLAYVGVNSDSATMGCDVFVNADMVLQGYARAVAGPHQGMLHWLLEAFQCQAYETGRGMWGACPDLTPPERCGTQPTPTPGPEQSATPTPAEGTGTPTATPSDYCRKKCATATPCANGCDHPKWRCNPTPEECNCDAQ
jgi:endonuclease YncB( thermonuclease family)